MILYIIMFQGEKIMKVFESLKACFKKVISLIVAFGMSIGLLSSFAADTDLSMSSLIVREGLRTFVQIINPEGGGKAFINFAGSIIATPKSLYVPKPEYELEKIQLENCTLELLKKKSSQNSDKVIYVLHGGAFFFALLDIYRFQAEMWSDFCNGATVAMLDYRVAPETIFPGAIEDTVDGWEWLLKSGYKPENIVVTGDSAGGNLALNLILSLRDEKKPLPKAAMLMSPWADLSAKSESYKTNVYKDPMFGFKEGTEKELDIEDIVRTYAGDADLCDPRVSPVYADYTGFCPTYIQIGTIELLYSESITISEKLKAAGVDVSVTEYSGMWHDFQLLCNLLPEGRDAWKKAGAFAAEQLYS